MKGMCIHAGGKEATFAEVQEVPLPAETDSYKPIPHADLLTSTQKVAADLLSGRHMTLEKEQYALARDGSRMFFWLRYKNGNKEMGYCIAGRNSYDKSMSVGMAFGANVFVCDNLALTGEVVIMRKHTLKVREDLRNMIVGGIYRNLGAFDDVVKDAELMKRFPVTRDSGYRELGLLAGLETIDMRVLDRTFDKWTALAENYQGEGDATIPSLWDLYNCCTDAMKAIPMGVALERYVRLHQAFKRLANVPF